MKRNERNKNIELNLTPLIDVLFNMILFLVIAAGFIKPGISLDLPQAAKSEKMEKGDIVISVDRDSRVYVEKEPVEIEKLAGVLSSRLKDNGGDAKKRVIFYGDESISYRVFVRVVDIIKCSGAEEVCIAHE